MIHEYKKCADQIDKRINKKRRQNRAAVCLITTPHHKNDVINDSRRDKMDQQAKRKDESVGKQERISRRQHKRKQQKREDHMQRRDPVGIHVYAEQIQGGNKKRIKNAGIGDGFFEPHQLFQDEKSSRMCRSPNLSDIISQKD